MSNAIHTSDARRFKRLWLGLGGVIQDQRRTGEARYSHPMFADTVRANDRRKDVPAVLLSRLNQLIRMGHGQHGQAGRPPHVRGS